MEQHEIVSQFEHAKEISLDMSQHFQDVPMGTVMLTLALLVAGSLDQVRMHNGPEAADQLLADFVPTVLEVTSWANADAA